MGEGAALIMMADEMDLDSKNTSAGGATCPAAASTAAEAEAPAAAAAMEVAALPEEDEVQIRTVQLSPIYGAQATNSAGSNGQVSEEPAAPSAAANSEGVISDTACAVRAANLPAAKPVRFRACI